MNKSPSLVLSPHEEITLRRIAYGAAGTSGLRQYDVVRLMALDLVAKRGDAIVLTSLGESRIARQLTLVAGRDPPSANKEVAAMGKALGIKL
jgi:hypothetical protein